MSNLLTKDDVSSFATKEREQSPSYESYLGGFLFRERMALLAERCCKSCKGDLIEIGAYAGGTTTILAEIARKYGRKVVAIDNWPKGTAYNLEQTRLEYYKNIIPHQDVIETWEVDAHSKETLERIKSREWCFALSDDGHQYEDHLAELTVLLPSTTGIVVADDVYYHDDVKKAMRDTCEKNPGWTILHADKLALREGYMVRT
jgi:predicted O-methyltransferase YrrM